MKNKILEAMACGAPIVATSRSLSGTPLIDGHHAMIADDDAKFIESVVRLLSEPALGESLSREARRKVETENSWQSVAMQYEACIATLCARNAQGSLSSCFAETPPEVFARRRPGSSPKPDYLHRGGLRQKGGERKPECVKDFALEIVSRDCARWISVPLASGCAGRSSINGMMRRVDAQ